MSQWSEASKQFEENSHNGQYFETQSVAKALKQIRANIKNSFPQMLFLLGEPGSGKSFLLNYLARYYKNKRYCLLIENPFLTPLELLRRMLAFAHVDYEGNDVEAMRILAIKAYKDTPHIIMIDEAQLASTPLREFIRILSDSKVFWFLIAMHKEEGESLLRSPHFYSRPHKTIYMGELKKDESLPFLKKTLNTPELWSLATNLDKTLIDKSWKLSSGNFRNFKKIYYNLFLLLDYANAHDRINFTKPNAQLFEMAALKAGLNPSHKNLSEFDELVETTSSPIKKDKKTMMKIVPIAILFFILLLLSILGLKSLFSSPESDTPKKDVKVEKKIEKKTKAKESKTKKVEEEKEVATPIVEKKVLVKKSEVVKTANQTNIVNTNQTTPNQTKETHVLTFYPPKKSINVIEEDSAIEEVSKADDIVVTDYESSLQTEPNFLDETQEIKPKKLGPILKLQNAKPKSTKELKDSYSKSPKYNTAIELAEIYYDKKDYKNASSWAKKANDLDRERESAWILFAKSRYKEGYSKDAKAALELFLSHKSSPQAKQLLEQWKKKGN